MKAQVRLRHGIVEVEGNGQKELFEAWSEAAEVFGETCCGKCKSDNIRPHYRMVDKFPFYEWICGDCGARLSFGQHKEGGTLFPKRRLDQYGRPDMENGTEGTERGWTYYRGQSLEELQREQAEQARQQAAATKPAQTTPATAPASDKPENLTPSQRVEKADAALAEAKLAKRNELKDHIQDQCDLAGYPYDYDGFTPEQVTWLETVVKAFVKKQKELAAQIAANNAKRSAATKQGTKATA